MPRCPSLSSTLLSKSFTELLSLPPSLVPLLPPSQLSRKLFREPPEHKARVLLLLPVGQGVPLAALYWAHKSRATSAWGAARWLESDAAGWQRGWNISRAPAVGVYRDPGLPPLVLQGEKTTKEGERGGLVAMQCRFLQWDPSTMQCREVQCSPCTHSHPLSQTVLSI